MSEALNQNQGPTNTTTASATADKEDKHSQPIELAHRPVSTMSGSGSIPPRLIGDASKPIYLVKQSGNPGATTVGQSPSVTLATHVPPVTAALIQQGPVVSVPIAMARIQTAIRPGTTVTLAPRTPAVVTTYTNVPVPVSHVPKGPAAVASIAIPRSAVATAAVIRPAPSASANAVPQTTRAASRPASIRPTVEMGSGSWVSVTPSTGTTATGSAPPIQTIGSGNASVFKAAGTIQAVGGKSTTTNLILTGTGHKVAGSTTSGAGNSGVTTQGKTSLPNVSSSITLVSVRGSSATGIRAPTAVSSTIATVPRISGEVIKSSATVLQPAAHRAPSMTITSTSNVQGVEKHYVKTVQGTGPAGARTVSAPPAGQIHIAARTVAPAAVTTSTVSASSSSTSGRIEVSAITTNTGATPVVYASGLKNITPITTVTNVGKSGQQGVASQFQMSVTAVASAKLGAASPLVAGTRTATGSGGTSVPLTAGMGGRAYLVTTQAPPTSSVIPVAKVLPQPASAVPGGQGASTVKAVDLSTTSVSSASETHSGVSSNISTAGLYLHAPGRPTAAPGDNASSSSQHQAHPVTQSNTPSKMGTSPRPSILRKRDYDGTPLKAQKNLTATLAMMTAPPTVSSTSGSTTVAAATPMSVSPPSPRRELVGLTPIASGPNGDSSRSSSGGSTTLSASSSPGIPPDMDESNPPINIAVSSASALLGKALSSIQVKQEAMESAESGSVGSALIRMGPSLTPSAPVEMSPRKKPRKQQLQGQELQEVRSSDDEMQEQPHVMIKGESRHEASLKNEPKEMVTVLKRPRVSLMSSYRQSWKARNHHFVRYSDVKLKDERRPTVSDLANQKHVMQKVHGWKIYHLSAQIDEMAYSESQVHDRLSAILEALEKIGGGKTLDRDMVRVNELIKGNLQRSKVIQDGLLDSKNQVHKLFDHKPRAEEIIHRYMFKRLSKKREKS